MPLAADLNVRLDIRGPVGTLIGVLSGAGGGLGGIIPPIDPAARDGAVAASAGLSLDGIDAAASRLSVAITPLLERIPGADGALPGIERGIALLQQAASPGLAGGITELIGGLEAKLEEERGGTLGKILRILELVRAAPETAVLRELAQQVEGLLSGGRTLSDTAFAGFAEVLPALQGALAALSAMARLDATLEEAERLSALAATQLDAATLAGLEAEITARLGTGPGSLAGFIASLDLGDPAAVGTAARELATISGRLGTLASTFRDGMAFGEATLVHLDLPALRQVIETIRAEVRGADLAPLERTLSALAGRLADVLSFDLSAAPVRSLEQLLDQIEAQAGTFSENIAALDVAALLGPLGEGLAGITALPGELAATLQDAAADIETALAALRDGVRELPLDDIANQLRQVANAIGAAIEVLAGIIGGVEDTIRSAANAGAQALRTAENGLDAFKAAVDGALNAARGVVEAADIDAIAAEIEANIRGFLDVVAQADMTPFFRAASDGIDTAAAVVEKVPFELLPDSMEQEVVDAIRPVKQIDADATRTQIEATLEIQNGRFDLRSTIEDAVAGLKQQVDQLIAQVRALDPQVLAQPVQQPINAFRARVQDLSLNVELAPLREALDAAKQAVAGLDPTGLLQPLDQAFDQVLAGIDRFSPAQLIAPLDQRLDQAREALIEAIGLRGWRERLDEVETEAGEMIALLDVSTLERDLAQALAAFQEQLADSPPLSLLDLLLAGLAPLLDGVAPTEAFTRVSAWIVSSDGAAALLSERAAAIRGAAAAMATAVAAIDPQLLADRLGTQLAMLTVAIATRPAGPARLQLEASLSIDAPLAELAAMRAPWRGYRDLLAAASQAANDLGAEGFAEVGATAQRIAVAASPLAPMGRLARDILRPLGLSGLERGLGGLVEDLLAVASPRRQAQIVTPLLAALRGRLQALVSAIVTPLRTAVDDMVAAIEVFDLSPLRDRLQTITDALKAEIQGFRPSTLLAAPLAAFADAKQAIAEFDPLGAINDALNVLRERVVAILAKLDLGKLLEQPIRLFAAILEALSALNVDRLLGPILDQLDAIAAQVQGGLQDTFASFKRLQDALPDQVGGTTVSVSVSVG